MVTKARSSSFPLSFASSSSTTTSSGKNQSNNQQYFCGSASRLISSGIQTRHLARDSIVNEQDNPDSVVLGRTVSEISSYQTTLSCGGGGTTTKSTSSCSSDHTTSSTEEVVAMNVNPASREPSPSPATVSNYNLSAAHDQQRPPMHEMLQRPSPFGGGNSIFGNLMGSSAGAIAPAASTSSITSAAVVSSLGNAARSSGTTTLIPTSTTSCSSSSTLHPTSSSTSASALGITGTASGVLHQQPHGGTSTSSSASSNVPTSMINPFGMTVVQNSAAFFQPHNSTTAAATLQPISATSSSSSSGAGSGGGIIFGAPSTPASSSSSGKINVAGAAAHQSMSSFASDPGGGGPGGGLLSQHQNNSNPFGHHQSAIGPPGNAPPAFGTTPSSSSSSSSFFGGVFGGVVPTTGAAVAGGSIFALGGPQAATAGLTTPFGMGNLQAACSKQSTSDLAESAELNAERDMCGSPKRQSPVPMHVVGTPTRKGPGTPKDKSTRRNLKSHLQRRPREILSKEQRFNILSFEDRFLPPRWCEPPAERATLSFELLDGSRTKFLLSRRHQVIGSDAKTCDVVVPGLAKEHCALVYHRSGQPYICFFESGELLDHADEPSSHQILDYDKYEELRDLPQRLRLGDGKFVLTGNLTSVRQQMSKNKRSGSVDEDDMIDENEPAPRWKKKARRDSDMLSEEVMSVLSEENSSQVSPLHGPGDFLDPLPEEIGVEAAQPGDHMELRARTSDSKKSASASAADGGAGPRSQNSDHAFGLPSSQQDSQSWSVGGDVDPNLQQQKGALPSGLSSAKHRQSVHSSFQCKNKRRSSGVSFAENPVEVDDSD
ncbi:unnamed protein product [Amoebophrya sp. A120]|nr:unnamed protein product [Amoebophrya sp. A120]|eukprot:GSA120T00005383001.1